MSAPSADQRSGRSHFKWRRLSPDLIGSTRTLSVWRRWVDERDENSMNVWIEVKRTKIVGRIIGWCPDRRGRPNAMVQVGNKVFAFKLREFRIIEHPATVEM